MSRQRMNVPGRGNSTCEGSNVRHSFGTFKELKGCRRDWHKARGAQRVPETRTVGWNTPHWALLGFGYQTEQP